MLGRRICFGLAFWVWLAGGAAFAQPAPVASPWQDDANLYGVQFLGVRKGWAVGDRGVIWHSQDGGESWSLQTSPADCRLSSLCFLTDRVGWIVGEGTMPFTRHRYGVVLQTLDGGQNWRLLARDGLPPLRHVKFFGMKEGIAVGQASSKYPNGCLYTADGGVTWQPVEGPYHPGWQTAAFVEPGQGVVAGVSARMVGNGQLLPSRGPAGGLRSYRDVFLAQDGSGWIVGDGGLVQTTRNRGLVWEEPAAALPSQLQGMTNFHAVAVRGPLVWLAGNPGGMIWHSPNGGHNWHRQLTGQTAPIYDLHFSSETHGWGVGALGLTLKTSDGGRTWKSVRGTNRRLAVLAIHASPERISLPLLVRVAGDQGYRSGVVLPVRRDIGANAQAESGDTERVRQAILDSGGNALQMDWNFPIPTPGLEDNQQDLLRVWDQLSEGRFSEAFLDRLVCTLRTWRPDVIVIDQPAADDAAAKLIAQALRQAMRQAGSPQYFGNHRDWGGLGPWQVRKLYERLPNDSTGQAYVDYFEYQSVLNDSVANRVAGPLSLLTAGGRLTGQREAYRVLEIGGEVANPQFYTGDFFRGIALTPGSEARRALIEPSAAERELRMKIVQRQRNFNGYREKFLTDDRMAGQLIAQLGQVTQGMQEAQAAASLAELAEDYRRNSQTDLYEATLIELVNSHPQQPAALSAMRDLVQLWGSYEMTWRRQQATPTSRQHVSTDQQAVQARFEKLLQAGYSSGDEPPELGPDPLTVLDSPADILRPDRTSHQARTVLHWQEQAIRMASLIRKQSPEFYASPEVQFPLIAVIRQRGNFRLAENYTQKFLTSAEGDPWREVAAGETWINLQQNMAPRAAAACLPAPSRPHLDGLLSDACWEKAEEILLAGHDGAAAGDPNHGRMLMTYDQQFLYLAGNFPRLPGALVELPEKEGRTHDADLHRHDRIGIYLDVDRDYHSHYAFHVDQRGKTHDACCGDPTWNPQWYVAVDATETHWRLEAAIPLAELVANPNLRGQVWSVGLIRTIPKVGVQSWTSPATAEPRPQHFGLIKFQ